MLVEKDLLFFILTPLTLMSSCSVLASYLMTNVCLSGFSEESWRNRCQQLGIVWVTACFSVSVFQATTRRRRRPWCRSGSCWLTRRMHSSEDRTSSPCCMSHTVSLFDMCPSIFCLASSVFYCRTRSAGFFTVLCRHHLLPYIWKPNLFQH